MSSNESSFILRADRGTALRSERQTASTSSPTAHLSRASHVPAGVPVLDQSSGHSASLQHPTSTQNPPGAQSLPSTSGARLAGSLVAGFVINGPGLQLPPQGVHDSSRPPPPSPIAPRTRKQTSNVGGSAAHPTASVPPASDGSSVGISLEFQPACASRDASQTAGAQHVRAGDAPTQRPSDVRSHTHGAQRDVPRLIANSGAPSAHLHEPPTAHSAVPHIPNRIPQPRVSTFAAGGQVYRLYHHNPPLEPYNYSHHDHSHLPPPSHGPIAPHAQRNHVHGNGPHAPASSAYTTVYRAPSQSATHAQQAGERYIECLLCHTRFSDGHKVPAAEHVLTKHIKPVFGNLILIAKTHLSLTDPARPDAQAPKPHTGERYCTFPGCGARFADLNWVTVRHVIASHLKPEYLRVLQEASAYLGLFDANGTRI